MQYEFHDHRDLALADAAVDIARLELQVIDALQDAVTYRWLYLELARRFLAAEQRAANIERQVQELMGTGDGQS